MNVKSWLLGVSMALVLTQADGRSFLSSIANLLKKPSNTPAPVFKATPAPTARPTAAPTPKPPVLKTIVMRSSVIPIWEQVAPREARSILFGRTLDYWQDLRSGDRSAYEAVFSSAAEKASAAAKIDAYYDGAIKCFEKLQELGRVSPEQFDINRALLNACMANTAIPSFVVPSSVSVMHAPSGYNPENTLDDRDYYPFDEEPQVWYEAPVVIEMPTLDSVEN